MDIGSAVKGLESELVGLSASERAQYEKAYHKSGLKFLGVMVPDVRRVAKEFCRTHKGIASGDLWQLFEALWETGVWELRTVGLIVLEARPDLTAPRDLPRLRELVVEADGWAVNDWIGCHIVGGIVDRNPSALAVMDGWAVDENLWVRRVAMQSLLLNLRKGDLQEWPRFVRYAEPLLEAKDFWTRKVIGWVCREASKKNPAPVFDFLSKNQERVAGLTMREGAKYLPEPFRCRLGLPPAGRGTGTKSP